MATYLSLELDPGGDVKSGEAVIAEANINTGDEQVEKLQLAYLLRARRYALDVRAQIRPGADTVDNPIQYPTLTVLLPSGPADIVFDVDLDAQLMQVYVIEGWPGIGAIFEALKIKTEEEIKRRRNEPSAGVPEIKVNKQLFPEAFPFFMFARDILALRIRHALITVEKIVAGSMFTRLQNSAKTFNDTAARLEIRLASDSQQGQSGAEGGPGSTDSKDRGKLKIYNGALLGKIHAKFQNLLIERKFLERQRVEIIVLENAIGLSQQHLYQKTEGLSGGVILPEEKQASKESQDIKTAQQDLQRIQAISIDSEQVIAELNAAIGDLCSLLLLVIPQLKDGFAIEDTEKAIIDTWQSMYHGIDELAGVVALGESRVAGHVPVDMEKLDKLESQFSSTFDVTATVAAKAIEAVTDDRAHLALISEEALCMAIDSGDFLPGSLEHIVAAHYVSDLIDALETRREDEELYAVVATWLSRISAVLSLTALAVSIVPTPQAKAAAVSIRTATLVLDIPLGMFYAYSALHQLGQLDEALHLRIVASGFGDIESIARITEVVALRSSLKEQLTEEFIKMLMENLAGRKWAAVKKYIHRRGYLYDIETLLPEEL